MAGFVLAQSGFSLENPLVLVLLGFGGLLVAALVIMRLKGSGGGSTASSVPARTSRDTSAGAEEEETDILKYFIQVMGVLTLVVGLFSIYYWVQALQTEKDYKAEVSELSQMKTRAADPEFKHDIQLWIETKGTLADTEDLQEFLLAEASNAERGAVIREYINNVKAPRPAPGQGYLAHRVTIYMENKDRPISMENLTKYLFNVQLQLPNVKVEQLRLDANDQVEQGWNANVTFVKYQPLEQPQGGTP